MSRTSQPPKAKRTPEQIRAAKARCIAVAKELRRAKTWESDDLDTRLMLRWEKAAREVAARCGSYW